MPLVHAIVGPNGAGKSTYFARVVSTTGLVIVNADQIAAQRWPQDPLAHAYDAAALAWSGRRSGWPTRPRSATTAGPAPRSG